jgi:hypothetical protein
VTQLRADAAVTASGRVVPADTIIWATGFRTGLADLLDTPTTILDAHGRPRGPRPLPGLWFHGYVNEPGGNLRHFRRRARPLAHVVLRELASRPTPAPHQPDGVSASPPGSAPDTA